MKRILLIIAQEGFQVKEYFDTRTELEAEGIVVVTGAPLALSALSHKNGEVMPDITLAGVRLSDYDGVFAIGGSGALKSLDNEETTRIFQEAQKLENYPYGAICISPRILAKAGVLKGKRATGWDNDGELGAIFEKYGVIFEDAPVVADGVIITANGPLAARDFGKKIAEIVRE
ncbi:MAG: DJ-1/PfpI family protein [Candidatus Yonathbacteria bacterium]|nr:DJ-1/PfpI family protein [Candidatus Yonathbacteria bacterium]